jgi:hypothetical protein
VVEAVVEKKFVVDSAVVDANGKIEAVEPVAMKRVAVGVLVAETTPVPLVARMPFCMEETVRLVVLAVPKNPMPLAEILVDDAPPLKVCSNENVFAVVVPNAVVILPAELTNGYENVSGV